MNKKLMKQLLPEGTIMRKLTQKENELLFQALQFYQHFSKRNLIMNETWQSLLMKSFSEKVWKRLGGINKIENEIHEQTM